MEVWQSGGGGEIAVTATCSSLSRAVLSSLERWMAMASDASCLLIYYKVHTHIFMLLLPLSDTCTPPGLTSPLWSRVPWATLTVIPLPGIY